MADYAPNYTPRAKIRYRAGGTVHSMTWRRARGSDAAAMLAMADKMILFLNTLSSIRLADWALLDASYCLEDSDVFLPLTLTETLDAAGGGAFSTFAGVAKANAFSYVGRGTTGQKAKFFVYGLSRYAEANITNDLRIYAAEDATFAASLVALTELAPSVAASDGSTVIWHNYVNQKVNDYWVGRARAG